MWVTSIHFLQVSYTIDGHACLVESTIHIDVIEAFKVEPKYIGMLYEPLSKMCERECCLFHVTITSQSPVAVSFKSSSLKLVSYLTFHNKDLFGSSGLYPLYSIVY